MSGISTCIGQTSGSPSSFALRAVIESLNAVHYMVDGTVIIVESQQHTARLEDECTTMSAALETNQKLHDAKVNELQLALQQQSEELHKRDLVGHQVVAIRSLVKKRNGRRKLSLRDASNG